MARVVLTDDPSDVPTRGHITGAEHHRDFAMDIRSLLAEETATVAKAAFPRGLA
jgi:hypothetical protein